MRNGWNLRNAVALSLGFHLLTPLFVSRCDQVSGWLDPENLDVPVPEAPIVFELINPPPGPESEEVPEETNLVSTKQSVARSEMPSVAQPINDLPSSEGDSPLKEVGATGVLEEPQESSRLPLRDPAEKGVDGAPSLLSPQMIRQDVVRSVEESQFDNRSGRNAMPGDLSFNTVDFEFAPYLLELKRRIESKWYPPVAAMHGRWKGATVIRFAVARNGALTLNEVIEVADHRSLDVAAKNAVEYGAPFPPLPEDFPEERWVITCTFHYR